MGFHILIDQSHTDYNKCTLYKDDQQKAVADVLYKCYAKRPPDCTDEEIDFTTGNSGKIALNYKLTPNT